MTCLVVALPAEARPIARHLSLAPPAETGPFQRFLGPGTELIVSGPGKSAAAAATAYLRAVAGGAARGWVNVGIAGCGDRAVGETVLAGKILDRASGRVWYPPLVFQPPCATATVCTVDRPELDFADGHVYEMEASGFFETATRFATGELVQVLKVVSDNRERPAGRLTAESVEELVHAALGTLDRLLDSLRGLSDELAGRRPQTPGLADFVARWRFTVTERRQLERLLSRLAVLEPGVELRPEGFAAAAAAGDVLRSLRRRLRAHGAGARR